MAEKDDEQLSRWMRDAVRSGDLRALRERIKASAPLPADVLARYQAGLLTPEEAALIEEQVALDPRNARLLAEMAEDIEAAADETAPSVSLWRRLKEFAASIIPGVEVPRWAYAGAAVLVLVALGSFALMGRPPETAPPYSSFLAEVSRGGPPEVPGKTLPWGLVLERVDEEWPLIQPVGEVSRLDWFAWAPLKGAESYTLRLYDGTGKELLVRTGLDVPHGKLPWRLRRSLRRGEEYFWVVEASVRRVEPIRGTASFRLAGR